MKDKILALIQQRPHKTRELQAELGSPVSTIHKHLAAMLAARVLAIKYDRNNTPIYMIPNGSHLPLENALNEIIRRRAA